MKKLIACLVLLLIPFGAFAQQPNRSAPERKKKSVKELRFYEAPNDSVPAATFYYDEEGRVTKVTFIEDNQYSNGRWLVETNSFDTRGRMVSVEKRYGTGNDPEKMDFEADKILVSTWAYTGDTMSFELDSAWQNADLLLVTQTTRTIHWKKYPAPFPKPLFWQDSLYNKTIFCKQWKWDFSSNGDPMPGRLTDSVGYFIRTKNFIENGKLYHVEILRDIYNTTIGDVERRDVCTLHARFDTVTTTRAEKHFPSFLADHPDVKDSMEFRSMQLYKIHRTGNKIWWVKKAVMFPGNRRYEFGTKHPDAVRGFMEEDNSLSQYYESWVYNSDDIEALTITYYEKYTHIKSRKEFIYR